MQRGPDCLSGSRTTAESVSLSTVARCQGSDKSARAATPIFTHNGAPRALVGGLGVQPFYLALLGHILRLAGASVKRARAP
jgi:hypothetical protein